MIDGRKVLGLIPARGGSKGLPGKNIADLGGKPLITWTIDAAKQSRYLDRLVLSSDDEDIIKVARDAGCDVPFVRPAELARDDTPSTPVILHAFDAVAEDFDILALLQPTSPLRLPEDIDACVERCIAAPACVSITELSKPPFWTYTMDEHDQLRRLIEPPMQGSVRRQDLPLTYAPNGALFVARIPWFRRHETFFAPETVGYVMPAERAIDIDGPLDLQIAALLIPARARAGAA